MKSKADLVVRSLKERLELPKCEAVLSHQVRQFWHGRGRPGNHYGLDTCGNFASVKIGRAHYCQKHAGIEVLKVVTERGYL